MQNRKCEDCNDSKDSISVNDIKIEDFSWWEENNSGECFQIKEEYNTRYEKATECSVQIEKKLYQCSQCDMVFNQNYEH